MESFVWPDLPPRIKSALLTSDKPRAIIGVIGKSSNPCADKLRSFGFRGNYTINAEDEVTLLFEPQGNTLIVHFNTPFDAAVLARLVPAADHFISFCSEQRTKFARFLLLATVICHVVVLVEPDAAFDPAYLAIFKSLKIIREKYVLKFLPRLLKSASLGGVIGKDARMCSPRFVFLFERAMAEFERARDLAAFEEELEESIYRHLRNEFIITNNSSMLLLSVSRRQRFVYVDTDRDEKKRMEPADACIANLLEFIEAPPTREQAWDDVRPFKGFAVPWNLDTKEDDFLLTPKRSFAALLQEYAHEVLSDESPNKFRGKSNFSLPSPEMWLEAFSFLHKVFIRNPENADFEATDAEYAAYLANFHDIMDIDQNLFEEACQRGLDTGLGVYKDGLPHHYSQIYHEQRRAEALAVFGKYARGPLATSFEEKLKDVCESTWLNGRQQCEFPSLRGNPCIMAAKHDETTDHSSGVVLIAACNCGKIQGSREDPYTVRQANFEFYRIMSEKCPGCKKSEKFGFPIFVPSINDFKAASLAKRALDYEFSGGDPSSKTPEHVLDENSPHLSASQKTQSPCDLSLEEEEDDDGSEGYSDASEASNEIVIQVGNDSKEESTSYIASTTEYLPGMLHTDSPTGLLPRFPSWSLVCLGSSSIYSHNTGIPEHMQSGFLTGTNYLLPWDVNVRLERPKSWAIVFERTSRGGRKKIPPGPGENTSLNLKIFVGCEYECPRGHRFFMSGPDTVLTKEAIGLRDSGARIVNNDMPLFHACPCRGSAALIAQLMRVHIVTPKAPVNVTMNPRVRIGDGPERLVFVTGVEEPVKLSKSTYWILRLPYVYEGDDGHLPPPLTLDEVPNFGFLCASIYGIKESDDESQ